MHARMAQSNGHPDAGRDGKAGDLTPYPRTPTARSGNKLDRPVSGLAHAALAGQLHRLPTPCGAVASDAVSYRLPLRGQRRNCANIALTGFPST
jgi:hypothetical protein